MKIKSITIQRRSSYEVTEKNPEYFSGSITLEGNSDYRPDIAVRMTPEQLAAVLGIIAPAVVEVVRDSLAVFHNELMSDAERLSIPDGRTVEATQSPAA